MINQKIFTSLFFCFVLSCVTPNLQAAFPVTSTDIQSVVTSPKQTWIRCTQVTVNGQTVQGSPVTVDFGFNNSTDCISQGDSGTYLTWIPGGPSTAGPQWIGPSCSSNDYPYLSFFREDWIVAVGAGQTRITQVRCCRTPKPTVAVINYWYNGASCP